MSKQASFFYSIQWLRIVSGRRFVCSQVIHDRKKAAEFYEDKCLMFQDVKLRMIIDLDGQGKYSGPVEERVKKVT